LKWDFLLHSCCSSQPLLETQPNGLAQRTLSLFYDQESESIGFSDRLFKLKNKRRISSEHSPYTYNGLGFKINQLFTIEIQRSQTQAPHHQGNHTCIQPCQPAQHHTTIH